MTQQPIFNEVQAYLRSLPKEPVAKLSFVMSTPANGSGEEIIREPTLSAKLNLAGRICFDPLIKLFEEVGPLLTHITPYVRFPEGIECKDCGAKLVLPYYYFFTSKVHRCIDCAEFENEPSVERMTKYPLMENSVLLFKHMEI